MSRRFVVGLGIVVLLAARTRLVGPVPPPSPRVFRVRPCGRNAPHGPQVIAARYARAILRWPLSSGCRQSVPPTKSVG